MLTQTGTQIRRFNQGQNTAIRLPHNWRRSGSVRLVDYGGRSNVLCLENKSRKAAISHNIQLLNGKDYLFSIDVYSALENEAWGVGTVNDQWHPSNGMWKRIEAKVRNGDKIKIVAKGKDAESVKGDRCYVDTSSIRVRVS